MRVAALVLAAGRGVRLRQEIPKAHVRLAGRSVLVWSCEALGAARGVDGVLPVVSPGAEPWIEELRGTWKGPAQLLEPVQGGQTRQESVARGLEALSGQAPDLEWVLVHDAARCLVEPGDAEQVLEAARETGAALPVVAVTDTIKELQDDRVIQTLERSRLARAQTPQAFRVSLLRRALERARDDGFEGTDCASLVERLGIPVVAVPGRDGNLKLTTPDDLERVESLLEQREAERAEVHPGGSAR